MLNKCSKVKFDEIIDFVYSLALDLTKSGYPTYLDGIKTKSMFIESLLKAFERDDEEILLYQNDGVVQGLIHYYWIPEDKYIQTSFFCVNSGTEEALSEFLTLIKNNFKGFELYMGFPFENKDAINYLSNHGFECIEDDYNNNIILDKVNDDLKVEGITQVKKDNFNNFKIIHDQLEGNMYWNSKRILRDFDNWIILIKENDNIPEGAVYYMESRDGDYEIFGIDIDGNKNNPTLFKELLNAAIIDCKQRQGKYITCFCDKEDLDSLLDCGFNCVGNYLCYKTII